LTGVVFGVALAIAIATTPLGNAFFDTAPVSLDAWLVALPFALGLIALEEVRKALVRRALAGRREAMTPVRMTPARPN
jgi:hypothetical protein